MRRAICPGTPSGPRSPLDHRVVASRQTIELVFENRVPPPNTARSSDHLQGLMAAAEGRSSPGGGPLGDEGPWGATLRARGSRSQQGRTGPGAARRRGPLPFGELPGKPSGKLFGKPPARVRAEGRGPASRWRWCACAMRGYARRRSPGTAARGADGRDHGGSSPVRVPDTPVRRAHAPAPSPTARPIGRHSQVCLSDSLARDPSGRCTSGRKRSSGRHGSTPPAAPSGQPAFRRRSAPATPLAGPRSRARR